MTPQERAEWLNRYFPLDPAVDTRSTYERLQGALALLVEAASELEAIGERLKIAEGGG
jgi:hypothetical protein